MEILTRYREPLVQSMDSLLGGPPSPILTMCRYHLGLADVDGTPTREGAGKMLRPALCLAMCEALGGDIHQCLPAALSLELTHRTSLIFDDVQDRSPQRNHRPTIWGVWGVDQAINAGLALSCYARLALHGMTEQGVSTGTFHEIQRLLEHTVIDLSRGQYLDIHYQHRSPDFIPSLDEYLEMVRLKTGVLLGVACEVAAVVAGVIDRREVSRGYGEALGVAFQMQDDYLGIWGEAGLMGKEPNDVQQGKVTLPLVLAFEENRGTLRALFSQVKMGSSAGLLLHEIERLGTREKTRAAIRAKANEVEQRSGWLQAPDSARDMFSGIATLLTSRSA